MEVREATEADIPAIVALLKISLGESLMPKSERYWRWKHLENPFGQSPVLLCWEGHELIGVRAFMRWEWIDHGRVYHAVRAVDTATHPDHQGKGIFKKLTLSLVEYCKQRGDHFVFNTPNEQSRPGYLKMGWEEAGKFPVQISFQRPFTMLKNFVSNADTNNTEGQNSNIKYYLEHANLARLVDDHQREMKQTTTKISAHYLIWRYIDVPVARYVAIGEEHGARLTGLIIGRIKKTRMGRELRITDYFLDVNSNGKELMRKFKESKKEWGIDYCTSSAAITKKSKQALSGLWLTAGVGPMVTIRSLGIEDLSALKDFKNWSPSLGDLELF